MSLAKGGLFPRTRLFRRLLATSILLFFPLTTFLLLARSGSDAVLRFYGNGKVHTPNIPRCSQNERAQWAAAWNATARDYNDLVDDRFTIALSTFHRPRELNRTLSILLDNKIPSLLEIVIIWNNFDEVIPAPFTSSYGVHVRYRKPPRDSLNEKLWNDPAYRTRAVLLSDDDVFFRPPDLEFVFQTWRRFGRERVMGALARCARVSPDGSWDYNFCRRGQRYAMVLTNLAFVDVAMLDAYFADFAPVNDMRAYVDEHFNCEDIALNFVAAARSLAGSSGDTALGGALLVRGSEQYVNFDPSGGISRQSGHIAARSGCLNRFAKAFGCMPLIDEEARIEYGVKHNVWYKTVADMVWS